MQKGLSIADISAVIDAVFSGYDDSDTFNADNAVDAVVELLQRGVENIRSEQRKEDAARVRKVFMGGPHPHSPLGLELSAMESEDA